jgi:hypothetical protein
VPRRHFLDSCGRRLDDAGLLLVGPDHADDRQRCRQHQCGAETGKRRHRTRLGLTGYRATQRVAADRAPDSQQALARSALSARHDSSEASGTPIADAEVRVLPAPASQSGLHRLTYEGRSKPCGTAAFRRYDSVSVCGIGPWRCHFGPVGGHFWCLVFTERRGGAAVLEPLMAVLLRGLFC